MYNVAISFISPALSVLLNDETLKPGFAGCTVQNPLWQTAASKCGCSCVPQAAMLTFLFLPLIKVLFCPCNLQAAISNTANGYKVLLAGYIIFIQFYVVI